MLFWVVWFLLHIGDDWFNSYCLRFVLRELFGLFVGWLGMLICIVVVGAVIIYGRLFGFIVLLLIAVICGWFGAVVCCLLCVVGNVFVDCSVVVVFTC